MKTRKGSLWTPLFMIAGLFVMVIALTFIIFILMQIEQQPMVSGIMAEILRKGINTVLPKVEMGMVFLFGTILVGSAVRAYQVEVPMILLFPGIAFIGIASWVVTKLANVVWRVINYGELSAAASKLTLGVPLVKNSLVLFIGASVFILIALHLSGRINIGYRRGSA